MAAATAQTIAPGEARQIDYLARARALGPLIAASADEIEQFRELPPRLVSALKQQGLYKLLLPELYGGAELHPAVYVQVIEEIASHDASTAWCLGQGCGCAISASLVEPEIAREVWGPQDAVVAWGPPGGSAMPVEGGFRVTGNWSFASGSHHATWLGAHIPMRGADGEMLRHPDGSSVFRTMLFPKPSATMTDIWHVIGLRGTGSDNWAVTDLFVPERYTIAREPEPKPRVVGPLYRFSSSNLYAAGFGGVALGIARRFLQSFIALASEKVSRGAKSTMSHNNVIQAQVAQAQARLTGARQYLLDTLHESWDGVVANGRLSLEENASLRLASTWAIHQARDTLDALYLAAGSEAIFNSSDFERRFRDMHAVAQQMQGRQTHFETVGRVRLGLPPDATMFTF